MSSIAWGVDGHGQQWPWCEDCGKVFGAVRPYEIDHDCPPRPDGQPAFTPDRITLGARHLTNHLQELER